MKNKRPPDWDDDPAEDEEKAFEDEVVCGTQMDEQLIKLIEDCKKIHEEENSIDNDY